MTAQIISYLPRRDALRTLATPRAIAMDVCSCGLVRLGYVPERTVGHVTHGFLCCYREEDK